MKLLILWNTAGAFTPIATWLNNKGHEARIVIREQFDPFNHTADSGCGILTNSAKDCYLTGIKQIRSFKPDVIVCSSSIKMLILARTFAPRTPIVLTYHGSDVRHSPTGKPHSVSNLADFIHVVSPDLQQYGVWIDRVVDEYFYYRGPRMPKTAFMYYSPHFYIDSREVAKEWCLERGIKLTILDRTSSDFVPLPNKEMPELYSKYEYYLDWKGQKDDIHALSRSAIEALACGCLVVHDSDTDKIIEQMDYPMATVKQYLDLYQSLERASIVGAIKRIPKVFKAYIKWLRGRLNFPA